MKPPNADTSVACPACRLPVAPAGLERHLRRVHQLYPFRGLIRTWDDTQTALLAALMTPRPDWEAWRLLLENIRELQGPKADGVLASILGQALGRLSGDARTAVAEAMSPMLAFKDRVPLVGALASDAEPAARQLALLAIARLPAPLDPSLLPPLRGLLLDRRLPAEAHYAALANVLRGVSPDHPLAAELIDKLVSGLGKARSIERLREFAALVGPSPVVDRLANQLEERLRMSCPRCGAQLRRPSMIQHLWDQHGLVLDGRRVKEPWSLIEDWLDAAGPRAGAEVMERCRELAERADPENGLRRVQRLLSARGLADADTRRTLIEDARERHAGVCPWCFAPVPVPVELPPFDVTNRGGRITSHGYIVEVSDHGVRSRLEVSTPDKLLSRDREPGRLLTQRGASAVLVGPLILLTALCALAMPGAANLVPLAFVLGLLLVALVVEIFVRVFWIQRVRASDRALEYAWQLLVPRLHTDGYKLEDSAFAAGLAQATPPGRSSVVRAPLLLRLAKDTEDAVQHGLAPADHLVAVRRLMIADSVSLDADPVPLVVDQVARCFEGKVPMAFAEHLLADWEADWWTPGNLARLRILLCDRAFEAGFEVQSLVDAGRSAPALAEVLKTNDVQALAALRLLWSLRPTRPWDRNGGAQAAFEIASDPPYTQLLAEYPDLLLRREDRSWRITVDGARDLPSPVEVLLCVRGVLLQGVLFTQTPANIEVINKSIGFDLILGERRFQSTEDLDGLARHMERWLRYWFNDFMPMTPNVLTWKPPDRAALLRAWGATPCPECGKYLLPKVGEVGVALDENRESGIGNRESGMDRTDSQFPIPDSRPKDC
jgi:hypothetical protein